MKSQRVYKVKKYENSILVCTYLSKLTEMGSIFVVHGLLERWVNGPHSAKSAKVFADAYFTMENT